jgi:hypothetical protein
VLGRELLTRLAGSTDIVLESFKPGYLASLGVGYEALKQVKPDLIMISLTDFGQEGPWVDFQMTDALHLRSAADGVLRLRRDRRGAGHAADRRSGLSGLAPGGRGRMRARWRPTIGTRPARASSSTSPSDACAVSTENAVPTYDFTGRVVRRQTAGTQRRTGRRRGSSRARTRIPVANLINVGPDLWSGSRLARLRGDGET